MNSILKFHYDDDVLEIELPTEMLRRSKYVPYYIVSPRTSFSSNLASLIYAHYSALPNYGNLTKYKILRVIEREHISDLLNLSDGK